jgi:hypothetical protein
VEGGAWQRVPFVSTRTVPVNLPRGSFVDSFRLLLDHEPPAPFLRQIEPGHGGMRTVKLYIDSQSAGMGCPRGPVATMTSRPQPQVAHHMDHMTLHRLSPPRIAPRT